MREILTLQSVFYTSLSWYATQTKHHNSFDFDPIVWGRDLLGIHWRMHRRVGYVSCGRGIPYCDSGIQSIRKQREFRFFSDCKSRKGHSG